MSIDPNPIYFRAILDAIDMPSVSVTLYDDGSMSLLQHETATPTIRLSLSQRRLLQKISEQF